MTRARIWIVRHGETEQNRNKIIQGQMDTVLNADGIKQAQLVADALQSVPFDAAFSSDLSRAVKTAEAILDFHPHIQLRKEEALRERYFGDLQGTAGTRFALASDSHAIERADAFNSRATNWWNNTLLPYLSSQPQRDSPYEILMMSHGGFIGTLVRSLIKEKQLSKPEGVFIGQCFNVSVTKIEMEDNQKGEVVQYGGLSHLLGVKQTVIESNADENIQ